MALPSADQMWEGFSRNVRSSASTVPPNSAPRKMLNTSCRWASGKKMLTVGAVRHAWPCAAWAWSCSLPVAQQGRQQKQHGKTLQRPRLQLLDHYRHTATHPIEKEVGAAAVQRRQADVLAFHLGSIVDHDGQEYPADKGGRSADKPRGATTNWRRQHLQEATAQSIGPHT